MATTQQTRQIAQDQRIVLRNISWDTYERILAEHESATAPRFTYDRGELEIMSPRPEHEEFNRAVALFVNLVAAELGIDARDLGSTTFRREDLDRGFEPDSCFYIQNERAIRGKRRIDLRVDPPPDLVIEVDITNSSIDKLALFSTLGVPELWRLEDKTVTFMRLEEDTYVTSKSSLALPGVTPEAITSLLAVVNSIGPADWFRRVQEWAKTLPRP